MIAVSRRALPRAWGSGIAFFGKNDSSRPRPIALARTGDRWGNRASVHRFVTRLHPIKDNGLGEDQTHF